jgi:glyoxylase-like metal-dependent hydrolase (beta-lactamase superfamily II)
MRALSPSLHVIADTCNVYALVDGDAALLVDFGSGAALGELASAGIEAREILVTHHHRDQVQGLPLALEAGLAIWVPLVEEALIGQIDEHWQARELANSYNVRQDRFSLRNSVAVTGTLADYARHRFAGYELQVVPTPGHTVGSITLVGEVDERRVGFTGDLLAGPGKVWSLAATQWTYNGGEGLAATVASLLELRELDLDVLLPAHGRPIEDPASAIDLTVERLRRLMELRGQNPRLLQLRARPYEPITPHLLRNRTSMSNSYVLLSDDGAALVIDYGYDFATGGAAGSDRAARRPSVYTIPALKRDFGVSRVDVAIPTHYHDDHVAGLNLLRQVEGTQVWAAESFVDVLERPNHYDLPCLWFDPIVVDRSLPLGVPIRWHEHSLELYQQPGHTLYAVAIALDVDGRRIVVVGDQLDGDGDFLNYVYSNGFRIDDYRESAELYKELDPDLLLFGHRDPLTPAPGYLAELWRRGAELAELHRQLLPLEDVDLEAAGPTMRLRPYRSRVRRGDRIELEVDVRNPLPRPASCRLRLEAPAGWSVTPSEAELELPFAGAGVASFLVQPAPLAVRRARVTADLTVEGQRFGELAEALVTVSPG